MKLSNDELPVWDMFFSEVAGWTIHPGFNRENARQPTLNECAEMADKMITIRRDRMANNEGVENEKANV